MLPNYLTKKDTPQTKGRKQEKIARNTISSGNQFFDKGDIEVRDSNDQYRVDVKYTERDSFSLNLEKTDKFFKQVIPQTPVYIVYMGPYEYKIIMKRVK